MAGTCGTKNPIPPAPTARTASGQSRLKSTAPGSSSGSEELLLAAESSPAIPGVGFRRRPSHSPAIVASSHHPTATSANVVSASRAAPTIETAASAVAAPPKSRTETLRNSRKRNLDLRQRRQHADESRHAVHHQVGPFHD